MSTFDQLSREVLQPKLLLDDLYGQWYWTLVTSILRPLTHVDEPPRGLGLVQSWSP